MAVTRKQSSRRANLASGVIPDFPFAPGSLLDVPGFTEYQEKIQVFWNTVKQRFSDLKVDGDSQIISARQTFTSGLVDASAAVALEAAARASADSAEASLRSSADASLTTSIATVSASVTTEATARATADSSLASSISAVEAAYIAADATIAASVTTEATARASADSAEASTRSSADASLSTSIGVVSASVTTEQSARVAADGQIHLKWGVALDVNGNVIGRINLDGTNQSSEFSVLATKFTVWNGTAPVAPFQVIGGAVRVNSLVINSGDVSGLAATATSSDFSAVTGATKPANNADVTLTAINGGLVITSGGITLNGSPTIKSNNYSAGSAGWIIKGDGSVEFMDGVFRGTLAAGGATGISTGTGLWAGYDGGVYKFRIGNPSGDYIYWDGTAFTTVGLGTGGAFTAQLTLIDIFKSGGNGGLTTDEVVAVIPIGGTPPYTYQWNLISGDGSAGSSTSKTTAFSNSGTNEEKFDTWSCDVTDADSNVATSDEITVSWIFGTPP